MRRLGLAFVLLLAACGSGDAQAPLDEGTEIELPTHPEWEDGMAALVGGIVEFDEATECIFLAGEDYRHLIVWPPETRATRDPFLVVLADGREIREGDHVEGGGGGYGVEPAPPEHCLADADGASAFNWHGDLVISESGEAPVHPAPQAMVPFAPDRAPMNGMTDTIEGIVRFQVETGCGLLESSGKLYAVVWPRGTTGELDPWRLTFADGTVAGDGDVISGRGGAFVPDGLVAFEGFPECAWESMDTQISLPQAWVFNHDEVIEVVEG